MIRAAGILAVVASLAIFAILAHRTSSGEVEGTVVQPPPNFLPGVIETGDWKLLYLRLPGKPEASELAKVAVATAPTAWVESKDPNSLVLGFLAPKGVAEAAPIGSELHLRVRECILVLWGCNLSSRLERYELRGPSGRRSISGPGNERFALTYLLGTGSPVVLWGLAAGIWALSRLRRGPSTTPPGSPGTPGSP